MNRAVSKLTLASLLCCVANTALAQQDSLPVVRVERS
jgi:hypothetical protein